MKLCDIEVHRFNHAYVCTGSTSFSLSETSKKKKYADYEVTGLHLLNRCVYIQIGGKKNGI